MASGALPPKPVNEMSITLLGNVAVGKTCLIRKFITGSFPENSGVTVGMDVATKQFDLRNRVVKMKIYDTVGQERFHSLPSFLLRSVEGVLLVFDLSKRQSYLDLDDWLKLLLMRRPSKSRVSILIVGAMKDNPNRVVMEEEGRTLARNHKCHYIEVSSRTGENVKEAFHELAEDILNMRLEPKDEQILSIGQKQPLTSGCTC